MNINNWKSLDSAKAYSSKLRQMRSADVKQRMVSMRRLHTRQSVRLNNSKLQLSQNGRMKVASRTPFQFGQTIRRAHNPVARHQGTIQHGEQKLKQQNQQYLNAKADAAKLKQKLSGGVKTSVQPAVQTKGKTDAPQTHTQQKGQDPAQTTRHVFGKKGKSARPEAQSTRGKSRAKGKQAKAKIDPKLADPKMADKTGKAPKAKPGDAAKVPIALKGQAGVKEGVKTRNKDSDDKKKKKSSLAENKTGKTVRDLSSLTSGHGINTNVGAGSESEDAWNTDNQVSEAISADRKSYMDPHEGAHTFTEPDSVHHREWNLAFNFKGVVKPRLEKIKKIHEAATGRLVELSKRLINDPNTDPALVAELRQHMNCRRVNAYGGISA